MKIHTRQIGDDDAGWTFEVTIEDGKSQSRHEVTLARNDFERLAWTNESAARFVERSFRFLLAREPKESILARFDVSVIRRYFPEFDREMS